MLNFDTQGETHNTKCGGFISILVKVILGIYIYLRFEVLILGSDDENSTMTYLLGSEERDYVYSYEEISFMLTPGIRSVRDGKKVIDYEDREVRKYIELTFVQMFQDTENANIYKRGKRYRYMKVKKCDYIDYQMNEQTKQLYEFNDRR